MRGMETSLNDELGKHFGPYELVRRLGVGGTAETFEAIRRRDGGFSQRVCLKVVLPFYADDDAFTRLFRREARLAAKLRHRNIVGVIDFGEVDGRSYLALELVDGIDLRTLLDTHDRNRLDPDLVVLFGLELAAALVHAHSPPAGSDFEGLVHRDISPSNVLISRQGEVLLTDFGVAKPHADARRKSSEAKGKFPYMSPEQLRAEPVDARSDLFAVGVVLFEALAGVRPYEGPNDPATIMQILSGENAELLDWVPDAPPKLCALIERLIHPDPSKRVQTATELIEELAELAPSPRVHKRLGDLVEERMEVERTTSEEISSTLGKPTRDTEPTPSGGAVTPAPSPAGGDTAPGSRSRLAWIGALAGALVLTLAGWMLFRPTGPSEAVRRTESPKPAETSARVRDGSDPPSEDERAVEPDPDRSPTTTSAPTKSEMASRRASRPSLNRPPARTKPATLGVVVVPWGDVWINGTRWGPAPMMSEPLKPGRYRVSAGRGKPERTRTVRVRAGEAKTLQFDLTEATR